MQKCMPYVKYTYTWPGSPNTTRFRAVIPLKVLLAGSSGSYASVSIESAPRVGDPSPDRHCRAADTCSDQRRPTRVEASRGRAAAERVAVAQAGRPLRRNRRSFGRGQVLATSSLATGAAPSPRAEAHQRQVPANASPCSPRTSVRTGAPTRAASGFLSQFGGTTLPPRAPCRFGPPPRRRPRGRGPIRRSLVDQARGGWPITFT